MYRTRLASTGRPNRARSRPPLTLERRTSMATEYVDAGTAIPYQSLSADVGKAPPVVKGVNYERILKARGAAELADLLRRLRRAALQPAGPDQREQRQATHAGMGVPGRLDGPALGRIDVCVGGLPDRRRRNH